MSNPPFPPRLYALAVLFSVLFALAGFSYNVWRLEVSEQNNNIRTASFEILRELAGLEQLIYSAHYDQDPVAGNPRAGWVKVGLIMELSHLTGPAVVVSAAQLHSRWDANWSQLATQRRAVDELVGAIDQVRATIQDTLGELD